MRTTHYGTSKTNSGIRLNCMGSLHTKRYSYSRNGPYLICCLVGYKPDTFVTDKATDQVSIPCSTRLNRNHYNTEDVMLGYTCYAKHTMKMSLLAKRTDLYYHKEPPETCIRYLSKYHPVAATIESIPSSQELSEIGIHYLQTQQLPQHLLLSKHKLALSKIKNTSLKLPVGVSPLQLVNSHRNRRYFVIKHGFVYHVS